MPPCRGLARDRTLHSICTPVSRGHFGMSKQPMKFIVKLICIFAIALSTPVFGATQVDINSADAKTLAQALDGVGLVKAEAIVAYRNAHGPFESVEDLAKVKGIGPHIIEANREAIVFGKPAPVEPRRGGSPHSLATWQ